MLKELVQYHIGIGISPELNVDAHAFTAGFIRNAGNSIDFFVTDKLSDLLNEPCLIYHVRKLMYQDPALSVRHGFNLCYCTHTDLSASCTVCFLNSSGSKDHRSCRKIRAFDDL